MHEFIAPSFSLSLSPSHTLSISSPPPPCPLYSPLFSLALVLIAQLSSTAEEDVEMRYLLHSFIAAEGSAYSQEVCHKYRLIQPDVMKKS